MNSRAPPKAARPWSSPMFTTPHEQPGSAEGRPGFGSYLVLTLTNLRAAYGGASREFDTCRVE